MVRGYQPDFSTMYDSMHAVDGRRRKAATMIAILQESLGPRLPEAHALNLGCSTGIIDEYLAGYVSSMTGVDIDEPAIAIARSQRSARNLRFEIGDAMNLEFEDGRFDIVICSQVYEHVPDAARMMEEIYRVLRGGGVCYFAATNRWAVIEKHHRLPFLSWLPTGMANRYMRWTGKGDTYYERHLGYRPLLKLVSAFRLEDFTHKVLANPARYAAGYMVKGPARFLASAMFRFARPMFPGYIWLLWKSES